MKTASIEDCIDVIEEMIPRIMKSTQFPTLRDIFGLGMDITLSQFYVLLAISQEDGCIMKKLANEMSLSPATMTGLVDRLEGRHLVKRKHDKQDRRAIKVGLTEKGRKFINEFNEKKVQYLREIIGKLGAETRNMVVISLRKLDQAIAEFLEERNITLEAIG